MKKTLRLALLTAVISAFSVGGVKAQNTTTSPTYKSNLTTGQVISLAKDNVDKYAKEGWMKYTGPTSQTKTFSDKDAIDPSTDKVVSKYLTATLYDIKQQSGQKNILVYLTGVSKVRVYNYNNNSAARKLNVDVTPEEGKTVTYTAKAGTAKASDTLTVSLDPTVNTTLNLYSTAGDTYPYAIKIVSAGASTPSFSISANTIAKNETAKITVAGKQDLDGLTLNDITYSAAGIVTVDPTTGVVTPQATGTTKITFNTAEVEGKYKATTGSNVTVTVTGEQAKAPTLVANTTFTSATFTVTITNNEEGSTVYYTTDGTDPTAASTAYTAPFTIDKTTTVKAIAIKDGMENSDIVTATYTKKVLLPQTDVTEATTWDFSKASSLENIKLNETTTPAKDEWVVYANVDGINNNADFNSQALNVSGEYMIRDGKFFQGGFVKFNTTVAGTLEVTFCNTGNRSKDGDNRYLNINGTNTTAKSLVSTSWTTGSAYVPAGEVTIKGVLQSDGSEQYLRISKIVFTPSVGETATIGAAGYATYVTKGDVDFSGETALKAFAAKFDETAQTIKLTAVNAAPANTPLVLKGAAGDYTLTAAATTPATVADNELQSASAAVTANGSQWILAKLNGGVGFAKCTPNTTIAAGKAYLVIPATVTAKSFIGFGDDTTNGIASVISEEASMKNARVYNLAGQQVNKAYKGVVIVNGKKYIQK